MPLALLCPELQRAGRCVYGSQGHSGALRGGGWDGGGHVEGDNLEAEPRLRCPEAGGPFSISLWVVQEKAEPTLIPEGWMGEGERVPWRAGGHTPCFPGSVLAESPSGFLSS